MHKLTAIRLAQTIYKTYGRRRRHRDGVIWRCEPRPLNAAATIWGVRFEIYRPGVGGLIQRVATHRHVIDFWLDAYNRYAVVYCATRPNR